VRGNLTLVVPGLDPGIHQKMKAGREPGFLYIDLMSPAIDRDAR